jgi:hypothetical protein
MVKASWRRAAWLVALLIGVGCDAAGPDPEFDETPSLALLITRGPPPSVSGFPADSGLFATLVITGTPIYSPYLRAERFEMRRLSDGARFAWRPIDLPTDAVPAAGPRARGNYFLPRNGGGAELGSDAIAEGESYELVVEAGPDRIVGRTRVPGQFEFVREATDGDSIVRWRRAPGAAAYMFHIFTDFRPTEDTFAIVRRPVPFPGEPPIPAIKIRVFALDSNYAAFASDRRVARSGISGGWGVFGSFSWGDTELPARSASVAPR